MIDFGSWLQEELEKNHLSQAGLARLSGLSTGGIAQLINGGRKPGKNSCIKIAKAFHYPPELVFRAANMLPPEKLAEAELKEIYYQISLLEDDRRNEVKRYVKFHLEEQEREKPLKRLLKFADGK